MLRRLLLVLAAGLLAAGGVAAGPEQGLPLVRNFLPRAYRGHGQVWAIVPGPGGTIVCGLQDEVAVFDGLAWHHIPVPGASFIRAMITDHQGTIWLAGVNELGRLVPGPDGRLKYESLRARVPRQLGDLGAIWCVHELADGIWFQGNTAVLHWTGDKFESWPMDDNETVLSYAFGGRLLVARLKGWFVPRPGGKWEQVGGPELGPVLPRFVVADPAGGWLIGTGRAGLQHFDGTRLTPVPTEADAWLKSKRPYQALRLPDSRLVITSLQGGALILTPDLRVDTVLDEEDGLATNSVISALHDRFGALWLGTDRGLARVDFDSPVRWFGAPHGLGRSGPETIQRLDGRIVVGGDRGMLRLDPPDGPLGRPHFTPVFEGTDRFNLFHPLAGGVLCGGLGGLRWLKDGKFTLITPPDGPLSNIKEIVESRRHPGWIFVTHLDGLVVLRREGGHWQARRWPLPRAELRSPVEDAAGDLWVSTPNGKVYRLHPAADWAADPAVEQVSAGLPEPHAQVWINEVGGRPLFHLRQGFFRYDDAARRFVPDHGFGPRLVDGHTEVRVIEPDDTGGVWLGIEAHDEDPPQIVHVRAGQEEQLPVTDIGQLGSLNFLSWERHDGREGLWIGGGAALLHVDLTAWRRHPSPPVGPTRLGGVVTGTGRRLGVPAKPGLRLDRHESTVRFSFGTPGLAGEPEVLHETSLEGFADGGVQLAAAGERTFTNLPPGAYVFRVRGRSADGRWSEPAQFAFTVLAPWWRTGGAILAWVLLAGALLFSYIRWRLRRLTRERRRLEKVVAERTTELAGKNRELERLHRVDQDEKLAARLAEEKAQLELLRYQLNPHFLYNSLNSIRALIFSNAEAAGEMVTRLSEFCRGTLTRKTDGLTTVGEEIGMLQAYLDIERTRWQDALKVHLEVDPTAANNPLPQFLFLPLIENAIKYGGRTSPGLLEVTVQVRVEGEDLLCEVANTGQWVPADGAPGGGPSTGIGLDNLRQRLARHYGPDCRPEILTMPGWVCVRLRLARKPLTPGSNSPA